MSLNFLSQISLQVQGKKLQFLKSEIDEWLISDSKEKEDLEAAIEEQTMRIRNNIRRRSL
mgnify:CR=1 FL=1